MQSLRQMSCMSQKGLEMKNLFEILALHKFLKAQPQHHRVNQPPFFLPWSIADFLIYGGVHYLS